MLERPAHMCDMPVAAAQRTSSPLSKHTVCLWPMHYASDLGSWEIFIPYLQKLYSTTVQWIANSDLWLLRWGALNSIRAESSKVSVRRVGPK
eukprot:545097-Pleurochrysis_carterae.AAC.1